MFQITVLVSLKVYILCLKSGIVSGIIALCRGVCVDTVHFHTGPSVGHSCSFVLVSAYQLHVRSERRATHAVPSHETSDIIIE